MTAIYLYCVVKAPRKPSTVKAPEGLPGSTRPEALHLSGSLWLIVGEVPLDLYGPGRLDRHLGDLDWVGRIALAHEAVVERFARKEATVVPMKLFTMFSTRARAVVDVASRTAAIEASMRRISGAEEWGIRIMHGEGRLKRAVPTRAASGAAFLAAKKEARDALRQAKIVAAEAAVHAYERLSKIARDARRREDAPSPAGSPPLLDAAFLVPSARRERFTQTARREAEACARAGARMILSGPWPAYNFVQGEKATA